MRAVGIAMALMTLVCGCSSSEDCAPHDDVYCQDGTTYWMDSCGNFDEVLEQCRCGCAADHSGCRIPCDCTPQCAGKCCGSDGCEGTCPDNCAQTGPTCNTATCLCEGSCNPQTCSSLGKECGNWDNGCGTTITCGPCPTGQTCTPGGLCVQGDCPEGFSRCGDDCVDVDSDLSHCGGCNRPCGSEQVCTGGACEDLPLTCPAQGCPPGSYCDLNQNKCVPGCLDDSGCVFGYICQNRACVLGCRDDAGCSTGQICQDQECIQGCRQDGDCPSGQICDNLQCRSGCRVHTDCPTGQVCRNTNCEPGCRVNSDCPVGEICVNTYCTTGCDTDAKCPSGQICEDGGCRVGCRPGSVPCTGTKICCEDTLLCEDCCDESTCLEDEICEPEGMDGTRLCREGCRVHEDCVFLLEPTYDDPYEALGTCSPVTKTCYPPCWQDMSVQGYPVRCEGTCISAGQQIGGATYNSVVCVPTWPDPGFPYCDPGVPDPDDGVCWDRPGCPEGTMCNKTCTGYSCERTIYPEPYWYRMCWPVDLLEGKGDLGPCSSCGDEPWGSCAAGRCIERNEGEGYYQCVDWCGTRENCWNP
jgi:hypothetical protein